MDGDIGSAAGEVYRFLEANESGTAPEIKKTTGLKQAVVNQAIGWLAREGKVLRQEQGRTVRWTLEQA